MSLLFFSLTAAASGSPTPSASPPSSTAWQVTHVNISPASSTSAAMGRKLADRALVDFSPCMNAIEEKASVEFVVTPWPQGDADDIHVTIVRTERGVFHDEGVWWCIAQTIRPLRWPPSGTRMVNMTLEEIK